MADRLPDAAGAAPGSRQEAAGPATAGGEAAASPPAVEKRPTPSGTAKRKRREGVQIDWEQVPPELRDYNPNGSAW